MKKLVDLRKVIIVTFFKTTFTTQPVPCRTYKIIDAVCEVLQTITEAGEDFDMSTQIFLESLRNLSRLLQTHYDFVYCNLP